MRAASIGKVGRFAWLDNAGNPVGKLLLDIGARDAEQYIMSMCDLEGMQAIVELQIALKAHHVPESEIATEVQQATERNSYTGTPLI
jgi:hypothetical protein